MSMLICTRKEIKEVSRSSSIGMFFKAGSYIRLHSDWFYLPESQYGCLSKNLISLDSVPNEIKLLMLVGGYS